MKVSQKIDSFLASLGVNVGNTGGSMLTEAMIAVRSVSMVAGAAARGVGGIVRGGSGSRSGSSGSSRSPDGGGSWAFKGGLAGMVSRKVSRDAVKTATTQTHAATATSHASHVSRATQSDQATAAHRQKDTSAQTRTDVSSVSHSDSATRKATETAAHVAGVTQSDQVTARQKETSAQTDTQRQTVTDSRTATQQHTASDKQSSTSRQASTEQQSQSKVSTLSKTAAKVSTIRHTSLGGTMFNRSLLSGGQFANDVIAKVASGDIRSTGSIKGDLASQALLSYTGITALGEQAVEKPVYKEVEIGGGRITGTEITAEHPEGIAFGMYHADQYAKPDGECQPVHTTDGQLWYKQYAVDTVVKTPFKAPDGEVDYHKEIVKKLPDPPKRKDRM